MGAPNVTSLLEMRGELEALLAGLAVGEIDVEEGDVPGRVENDDGIGELMNERFDRAARGDIIRREHVARRSVRGVASVS